MYVMRSISILSVTFLFALDNTIVSLLGDHPIFSPAHPLRACLRRANAKAPATPTGRRDPTFDPRVPGRGPAPRLDRRRLEAHLQEIFQLILDNGVEEKFGVHLIYGHLQNGEDEVMFGKALTKSNIRGAWTRPTRITELDLSNIHGHIFALNPDSQFKAYEYREGPLAAEFDPTSSGPDGTVMLDANDTNVDKVYRVTGWSVETNTTTSVSELKGNDHYAPMQNGNHKIFQDSSWSTKRA
ncbi:hypothetical protein PG989_001178 [Apiospora arundinis]